MMSVCTPVKELMLSQVCINLFKHKNYSATYDLLTSCDKYGQLLGMFKYHKKF